MSKDTEKELVLNFQTPSKEQLIKNGEEPDFSVIAIHPKYSEVVSVALEQLLDVLHVHMPPDHVHLMEEEAIEMNSGKVLELGPYTLFFSLSYPTEVGRTYELQFGAPPNAVLH